MDDSAHRTTSARTEARDAEINEAARREILRRDGERDLGENLEQAAALIKVSFELRDAFADAPR
jgi:hypothetical protein